MTEPRIPTHLAQTLCRELACWYGEHRRAMPWRETADPYRIWLSEVILQQTRVAQGTDYYLRFTERFADVAALAAACEQQVLRLWQGLGYYSRARNLHAAARQVMERHGGVFPQDYAGVRALPGVGDYTAAAICSICYGLPHAAVDGNVLRVLTRLFDVDTPVDSTAGQRLFRSLAEGLLDRAHPGAHNQAVMELGALVCLPRSPRCAECPLARQCLARERGRAEGLPVKQGRTKVTARWFNYLDLHCDGRTVLVRRSGRDIWQGLYEYPLIETGGPATFEELERTEALRTMMAGRKYALTATTVLPRHPLSHRVIHASVYRLEVNHMYDLPAGWVVIREEERDAYPVPQLIASYRLRVPGQK